LEDTTGKEVFLDEDCDAQPEGLRNNKGTKRLSTVGNEDVAGSALLEIARFARVANKYFVTPDEEDLPSP
jgi:hypothetical protein